MHKEMCVDIYFTVLEAIECEMLSELRMGLKCNIMGRQTI